MLCGTLANAASVGANTVNLPLPSSVSTRPACVSREVRVSNCFEPDAMSAIDCFFVLFAPVAGPAISPTTSASEAIAATRVTIFFIMVLLPRLDKPLTMIRQSSAHGLICQGFV